MSTGFIVTLIYRLPSTSTTFLGPRLICTASSRLQDKGWCVLEGKQPPSYIDSDLVLTGHGVHVATVPRAMTFSGQALREERMFSKAPPSSHQVVGCHLSPICSCYRAIWCHPVPTPTSPGKKVLKPKPVGLDGFSKLCLNQDDSSATR